MHAKHAIEAMDRITQDEATRVRIARLCGWKDVGEKGFGSKDIVGTKPGTSGWPFTLIPDFLNDLNAIHEAEKILTDAQMSRYHHVLCHEVCAHPSSPRPLCATARQRALAFLACFPEEEGK